MYFTILPFPLCFPWCLPTSVVPIGRPRGGEGYFLTSLVGVNTRLYCIRRCSCDRSIPIFESELFKWLLFVVSDALTFVVTCFDCFRTKSNIRLWVVRSPMRSTTKRTCMRFFTFHHNGNNEVKNVKWQSLSERYPKREDVVAMTDDVMILPPRT